MAMQVEKQNNTSSTGIIKHPELEVEIFTDPLCCWSWAFQPQLELVQSYLSGRATWRYRMGGLISSWNNFLDEVNSISRPAQMGPVWMHAGQVAEMPIFHQLWVKDPPSSSYPACIAVKCAQLQSDFLGTLLLKSLRDASMVEGRNTSKQSVLFQVATELSLSNADFDLPRFKDDYSNDKGLELLRADLDLVRKYNINRFPTLIMRSIQKKAIIISGYRTYMDVLKAVKNILPDLVIPEE